MTAVRAAGATGRDEVRLQLMPAEGGGHVDGAWWPRSRDAGVEFADLVAAVRDQVGEVERISYPQNTATPTLETAADPDSTASPEHLLAAWSSPPVRANG